MPRKQRPYRQKPNPRPKADEPPAHYLLRPGRTGRDAVQERTPELRPLADKAVAVFGVGALGAPSALELARAGVGELRLVDHDHVDPATAGRWPFGLAAAGLPKVDVLEHFIAKNYPDTKVRPLVHYVGGVRVPNAPIVPGQPIPPSETDILRDLLRDASLVYDATVELGVQYLLSDLCLELGLPYVAVAGTRGGWGGSVVRVLPERQADGSQGCWMCYRHADHDGTIPKPPANEAGVVQPVGCADPTFTGSGFDLQQVALAGVRCVASTLCAGANGAYPPQNWDVLTIALRDEAGRQIPPECETHDLAPHPSCPRCGGAGSGGRTPT